MSARDMIEEGFQTFTRKHKNGSLLMGERKIEKSPLSQLYFILSGCRRLSYTSLEVSTNKHLHNKT
jgi:hypothetical protein